MENQEFNTQLEESTELDFRPAGFWIRVGASFLDFIALAPLWGFNMYNIYFLKNYQLEILVLLASIFYKPFMEYRYGATFGKMAVKIRVVNAEMNQITLPQSVKRYAPWLVTQVVSFVSTILLFTHPKFEETRGMYDVGLLQNELVSPSVVFAGSLIMFVSCLWVAFDSHKQGLHDKLADTYCVYE